jgi:hypothetical protein
VHGEQQHVVACEQLTIGQNCLKNFNHETFFGVVSNLMVKANAQIHRMDHAFQYLWILDV